MRERPILFSGPMVRALLSGTKTQTRRVGSVQRDDYVNLGVERVTHATKGAVLLATYAAFPGRGTARWGICECPYGVPGDRLWVKETFSTDAITLYPCPTAWYRATDQLESDGVHDCPKQSRGNYADCLTCWEERVGRKFKWKPSIFMPRAASRITLEIVSVRVERLQEISEADAVAEGIKHDHVWDRENSKSERLTYDGCGETFATAREAYRHLWISIHGPESWALNPWVWVVEFKRL